MLIVFCQALESTYFSSKTTTAFLK